MAYYRLRAENYKYTSEIIGHKLNELLKRIGRTLNISDSLLDHEIKQNRYLIDRLREAERAYNETKPKPKPKFGASEPTSLGIEEKLFFPKSEEEIVREASIKHDANYQNSVDKATLNRDSKQLALDEKAQKLAGTTAQKLADIDKNQAKSLLNQQNKMIMQGLTSSSVAEDGKRSIMQESDLKRQLAEQAYETEMASLEAKKQSLDASFEQAVKEYDFKRALNIENDIAKLVKQQESLRTKTEEFNEKVAKNDATYLARRIASIKKEMAAYPAAQAKAEKEQAARERLYGYDFDKDVEMKKRYLIAKKFYDQFDRRTATYMIRYDEKDLQELLGNYYTDLISNYA